MFCRLNPLKIHFFFLVWTIPVLIGCTEPNPSYDPSYEPPSDMGAPCSPGDRTCSGQMVLVCRPNPAGTRFEAERLCPSDSTCEAGICIPSGPACSGTCDEGKVCTVFINPKKTSELTTFCANASGQGEGGATCTNNMDCQSGFCLIRDQTLTCYSACASAKGEECAFSPDFTCMRLTITVNGVKGPVNGCVPRYRSK